MKDTGLTPKNTLSPAEQAVDYILQRLQNDPELAYYMGLGTESLNLLCKAHAHRVGQEDWQAFQQEYCKTLRVQSPPDCDYCDQGDCDLCNYNDCDNCEELSLPDSHITSLYQFNIVLENSLGIADSQGQVQNWNSFDPVGDIRKTIKELANLT